MQRPAPFAALIFALAGCPLFAAVKVVQGVAIGDVVLTVTNQRDVFVLTAPGRPARLLGRLPRHHSGLVSDGLAAWAVTTGERQAPSPRLFQMHPAAQAVLEYRLEPPSIGGRVDVEGVAGADSRYVYLKPGMRVDLLNRVLERGHLAPFPDLEVLGSIRREEETCYLARDRSASDGQAARLWLLHSAVGDAAARKDATGWLKVEAGAAAGDIALKADEGSLFLVFAQGRILRFDRRSLRFAEDLSPMLRPGPIRFFAVDARSYWVGQDDEAGEGRAARRGEDAVGETPGSEPATMTLRQIDREVLDGGAFHAGAVPEGFQPLDAGQGRIWFGSKAQRHRVPLVAVSQADGTAQSYSIRGVHARRWAAVGQGFESAGEMVLYGGMVSVALGVITLPIWIWFV